MNVKLKRRLTRITLEVLCVIVFFLLAYPLNIIQAYHPLTAISASLLYLVLVRVWDILFLLFYTFVIVPYITKFKMFLTFINPLCSVMFGTILTALILQKFLFINNYWLAIGLYSLILFIGFVIRILLYARDYDKLKMMPQKDISEMSEDEAIEYQLDKLSIMRENPNTTPEELNALIDETIPLLEAVYPSLADRLKSYRVEVKQDEEENS